MEILRVKIDNLSRKEILEKIESFLTEDKVHQIATINPEFILQAQKDEEFKNILNSCDLNVADGFGLNFAFWKNGKKLKSRMAGIDLMWEILKIANEKKLKIFLAANSRGLSTWEETKDAILKNYPDLIIDGVNLDNKISNFNPEYSGQISNSENYEVIFCNFGAPCQERFLNSLKAQKNAKIRLVMGVGGAFDFMTGKVRRAPLWMRKMGLEWLFRLIRQPSRFRRIFRAVIIFPIKIATDKF